MPTGNQFLPNGDKRQNVAMTSSCCNKNSHICIHSSFNVFVFQDGHFVIWAVFQLISPIRLEKKLNLGWWLVYVDMTIITGHHETNIGQIQPFLIRLKIILIVRLTNLSLMINFTLTKKQPYFNHYSKQFSSVTITGTKCVSMRQFFLTQDD